MYNPLNSKTHAEDIYTFITYLIVASCGTGGYWTTDGNGNLTASDADNYNVAFDAVTHTLTLNNATIVGSYDANNNPEGTGIYAGSRSGAVSLTIQVTGNNVVSGAFVR